MRTMPAEHSSPSKPEVKSKTSAGVRQSIYQSVWRWHFYAGIIFAPFLIILAFSGAVYLFKPQIEGYLYKDMLTVREVGTTPLALENIADKIVTAYPGTVISSITLDSNAKSIYKLSVTRDGASTIMYVDPYTGHALSMMDSSKTFSAFFKKMHSELVIGGTFANRLVELAACWAIILILTGLFLWWPRSKAAIWGTILPRLSKPGSRLFWRDLHAVPAFWLSLVLLVIIASGLPWSGIMGGQIDKVANSTNTNTPPFAYSFEAKPDSVTLAKDIAEDLPWAAENVLVPASIAGGYVPLSLNDIAGIADEQQVIKPYTITKPAGETGVFTVSTAHSTTGQSATLHIDQYSGAVLSDVRFADYGIMA